MPVAKVHFIHTPQGNFEIHIKRSGHRTKTRDYPHGKSFRLHFFLYRIPKDGVTYIEYDAFIPETAFTEKQWQIITDTTKTDKKYELIQKNLQTSEHDNRVIFFFFGKPCVIWNRQQFEAIAQQ